MSMASTINGSWQAARVIAAAVPVLRAGTATSGNGDGDGNSEDAGAQRARRHLAEVLGQLRGLPTKLGQWLAGGPQGDDYTACTEDLQPMPWTQIRSQLEKSWGCAPEKIIARVDEHGHAASLGQVHRAWLHDGRQVAIKIQYPGIGRDLDAVMSALALVPGLGPIRRHGIDLDGHRQLIRDTLARELDYRLEAQHQQRAAATAPADLIIPRVHSHLSNDIVLVQDWEDGVTLAAAKAWPQFQRNAAGAALVRRFLCQTLNDRLLHADPHPGNLRLRVSDNGVTIVQYDHGCMAEISAERAYALKAIVIGTRTGTVSAQAALSQVGFSPDKLAPISAKLPTVVAALLAPLLVDHPFIMCEWHPAASITQELGEDRWWFRAAGSTDLFLITRAFGGLVRQLQQLGAVVDWPACWKLAVGEALPPCAKPVEKIHQVTPSVPVTRLHILVTSEQADIAHLELPATCTDSLSELMEPAVAEAVARIGIDLDALAMVCRSTNWQSAELFSADYRRDDGALRHVRVWLK